MPDWPPRQLVIFTGRKCFFFPGSQPIGVFKKYVRFCAQLVPKGQTTFLPEAFNQNVTSVFCFFFF